MSLENTGYKAYTNLAKVTNDGTNRPLDVNNNLCSESGLPQDIKPNSVSDPNYIAPILDVTFCPINNIVRDIVENNNGNCDGYFSFKVVTNSSVTIEFTSDFKNIASYSNPLPLPSGYLGVTSNSTVTTSSDQGYMCGISATKLPNGATGFTSRIIVQVRDTATSTPLFRKEFSRNHTNEAC